MHGVDLMNGALKGDEFDVGELGPIFSQMF